MRSLNDTRDLVIKDSASLENSCICSPVATAEIPETFLRGMLTEKSSAFLELEPDEENNMILYNEDSSSDDSISACSEELSSYYHNDAIMCSVKYMNSYLDERDYDASFSSLASTRSRRSCIKQLSSRSMSSSKSKKVSFALSDEYDDSSLIEPSCIYIYENPILLMLSESNHKLDNKDEFWWTAQEQEDIRRTVQTELVILREQNEDIIRGLIRCFKTISNRNNRSSKSTEETSKLVLIAQALNQWAVSDAARGLENKVTRRFKQEAHKAIDAVLDSQHQYYRQQQQQQREHFLQSDSSTYDPPASIAPLPYRVVAEQLRRVSMEHSYSSKLFAYRMALADAQYAKEYCEGIIKQKDV